MRSRAMSHPLFTPEESARQARKLSDAINEVIRESFGPLTAEEKRRLAIARQAPRPMGADRLAYETARTRPDDELDDLVADLRRVETENSNKSRRL